MTKTKSAPVRKFKKTTMPVKKRKIKSPLFDEKAIRVEKKSIDFGAIAQTLNVGTWSAIQLMNPLQEGTSGTTRIGRDVLFKSLQLRFESLSTGYTPCRIAVIYDKAPTGSSPTITDIMQSDAFTTNHNSNNTERFVTIIDHVVNMQGGNATAELFRKLSLMAQYKSNLGTVADFTVGAIYLLVCGASTLAAPSTYTVRAKLRYSDQ